MIHRDIPRIGTSAICCSPRPTDPVPPGDDLDTCPPGTDILAMPAYGPWAAMKETVDFVRAIGALEGFPIHDQLLSERGFTLVFNRINEMTGTRLLDLRSGSAHEF